MSQRATAILWQSHTGLSGEGWMLNFIHGDVVEQIDLDFEARLRNHQMPRDADMAAYEAANWLWLTGLQYVHCGYCGSDVGEPCVTLGDENDGVRYVTGTTSPHKSRVRRIEFSEAQSPLRDAFYARARLKVPVGEGAGQ